LRGMTVGIDFYFPFLGEVLVLQMEDFMKVRKRKITSNTVLYYTQEPSPELVQMVNSHFDYEMGSLPEQPFIQLIKRNHDRPREIYTINYNGETYYVKRFYSLNFKDKIRCFCLKPRGLRSYCLALQLQEAGFNTPEPVFAMVHRKKFLHGRESILLSKAGRGITLKVLAVSNVEPDKRTKIMNDFIETLGRFYKKGFVQTDTNLGNFLVDIVDNRYQFTFLDIDAIIYMPFFQTKLVLTSIARFYACIYRELFQAKMLDQFSFEKLLLTIITILMIYNSRLKLKSISFVQQRIERNLNKWLGNKVDYSLIEGICPEFDCKIPASGKA
jgi:hypothetical protein